MELDPMEIVLRISNLEKRRTNLHVYATMKLEEMDYHAVADAAMDLREVEARIGLLKEL